MNNFRNRGYTGLSRTTGGMEELARQLTLSVSNPVWEQVRAPAPWAERLTPTAS